MTTKYSFKIILVGDSYVGKSNIMYRYVDNSFSLEGRATVGIQFMSKVYAIDTNNSRIEINAQIWDTAGQERYDSVISTFYRGAIGIMLIYDVADRKSFNALPNQLEKIKLLCNPNAKIILVGNKIDLNYLRTISEDEGRKFANENNLLFAETSALSGTNIDYAFNVLINSIYTHFQKVKILESYNSKVAASNILLHHDQDKTHQDPQQYSTKNTECCIIL